MAYGGLLFVAACLAWCIVVDSLEDKKQELGADSEELGAEYIGCYKDGWGRDLPNVFIKDYSGNTPQKCISQCEKKGFVYAAVQYSWACFCGNSYGKYGSIPESSCQMSCSGNKTLKCGGGWANAIYKISYPEELGANSEELGADYIGCYKDTNDRDLPDVFIKDYSGNTPQKCISQCETQGFVYAAVQYSWACFCGNSYGKYGSISQSSCQMACSGNKALKCGGGWANAIYKISYPETNSEAVVFSAELSTDLPRMNEPTKVAFDHVFTNAGNGYDVTSGIFTAPKAGYYSISAALLSWYDSRFFVMLNGKGVQYIASLGHWQADSATVNLKLAEDDKVWIEAIGVIYGSKHCVYPKKFGDEYKCYPSSFSGFLIKEE